MEITPTHPRRLVGVVSYLLMFVAIAGIFGWLLTRFTNSAIIAIALVAFMIGYMTIMAYFASRNLRR